MLNICCKLHFTSVVLDKWSTAPPIPAHPPATLEITLMFYSFKKKKTGIKIAWGDVIKNYHNASGKKTHQGYLGDLKSDTFLFFLNPWFSNFNLLLTVMRSGFVFAEVWLWSEQCMQVQERRWGEGAWLCVAISCPLSCFCPGRCPSRGAVCPPRDGK